MMIFFLYIFCIMHVLNYKKLPLISFCDVGCLEVQASSYSDYCEFDKKKMCGFSFLKLFLNLLLFFLYSLWMEKFCPSFIILMWPHFHLNFNVMLQLARTPPQVPTKFSCMEMRISIRVNFAVIVFFLSFIFKWHF